MLFQVNPKEREAAERAYLKKYAKSWLNAGGNPAEGKNGELKPEFVELHPRYEELIRGLMSMSFIQNIHDFSRRFDSVERHLDVMRHWFEVG